MASPGCPQTEVLQSGSQEVALEEWDGDPREDLSFSPLHRNLKQTWDPG